MEAQQHHFGMDACTLARRIVYVIIMASQLSASAAPVYVYSGDFNLRIPEGQDDTRGWMTDAVIEVPDHIIIGDLDVGVTVKHTKVFDLQIFLESPAGTTLCLNRYDPSTEYFEGEDYIGTIFDDEATTPIEQSSPPFTGRYKPRSPGSLTVFDCQDAQGKWRLKIYDAYYADSGYLSNFELMITLPEPGTILFLSLGVGVVSLCTRWRFN
jgi:subtilisin-like proprotein convertase family protein